MVRRTHPTLAWRSKKSLSCRITLDLPILEEEIIPANVGDHEAVYWSGLMTPNPVGAVAHRDHFVLRVEDGVHIRPAVDLVWRQRF